MRILSLAIIGATAVALAGCGSNMSPVAVDGTLETHIASDTRLDPSGARSSVAGAFQIDIDVDTMTSRIEPLAPRTGAAIGDLFFLNVDNFGVKMVISPDGGLRNLDLVNNTIEFHYDVSHAFPAPATPGGTASAGNRADLGIAGRVVFLCDVPLTDLSTFAQNYVGNFEFPFSSGTERMHTLAILDAHGYYNPAGMLDGFHTPTNGTTAWPYKMLVDESMNARRATAGGAPISNGGLGTGNYASSGSWGNVAAWTGGPNVTGYGVLHQGQTVANYVVLNIRPGANFGFKALVIANYSDPRGGANASEKRANRLPKDDTSKFAYKMPHGAVDMEAVGLVSTGPIDNVAAATVPVYVGVLDQDFAATVGTSLTDIPNPSGIASIEIASLELGAQVPVTDTPVGTGTYEDPVVFFNVIVTNDNGTQGGIDNAAYVAVRIVDEQDNATPGLEQGLTLNNSAIPVPVSAGQEQHPVVLNVLKLDIDGG